jgi:hypothetical protein
MAVIGLMPCIRPTGFPVTETDPPADPLAEPDSGTRIA